MANYQLRQEARNLRKQGVSVKVIAKKCGIARSTASIWVRDIILTIEQLEALRQSSLRGSERGRLKSAFLQKEKIRINLEKEKLNGFLLTQNLTKNEVFIAGLALYWGEGGKRNRRIEFCNSDPKMIQFVLSWLKDYFQVQIADLVCTVGINEIHEKRDNCVKEYWSNITKVPISQFYKTSFKHSVSKKVYDNFEDHYGTLSIIVRKSAKLYYKIIGLVDGLSKNLPT